MGEKTAAELMVAQLEYDVAEAKQVLMRELRPPAREDSKPIVEAIDNLMAKSVMRWWLGRIALASKSKLSAEEYRARSNARLNLVGEMVNRIKTRSGETSIESLQLQIVGLSCELQGVWGLLEYMAFTDQADRQEWLDHGVAEMHERVTGMAAKLVVTDGGKIHTA